MKSTLKYSSLVFMMFFAAIACSKNNDSINVAFTVENISGTYILRALVWNYGGFNFNVYDSLEACEKDNYLVFNTDKTIDYIDGGTVCTPSSDDSGTWDVIGDSIIFSNNFDNAKIESYDGKYLILSGTPEDSPGVKATSTFEKQ